MKPGKQGKGQALVETALAMPVLIALLMGIYGFGQIYSTQLTVVNATREGARLGALGHPQVDIVTTVQTYLSNSGLPGGSAVVNVTGAQQPTGQQVAVQVTLPVTLALNLPGVPNPLPLSSQAVMRIE